jgi:ABC-2 type transport system permease protein
MNKTYKKPSQFRAFVAIAWFALKAQTRNPATFAFGFIFPIVFISVFGLIGTSTPKLSVGIPYTTNTANPVIETIQNQPIITVQRGSEDELEKKLAQGKLAGIVSTDNNAATQPSTITVLFSTASPQEAGTLKGIVNGIVDKTNLKMAGITTPFESIIERKIEGRQARYIDFALPGQIGFSLLSTAIFGTVFGLIYLKKAGVLKRMFATPTKALTILLAQGLSRLVVALMQTMLILVIGVLVFKFYLPHGFITLLELILLSTIGLIAFLGFGYFFAGLANDENSAGPLVNLVTLPQFLLSGTFFSTDSLPTWLQPIANNLPLSYFNMAVRKITTEGGSLSETTPYIVGLLIWGAVMYILAARTFKWE